MGQDGSTAGKSIEEMIIESDWVVRGTLRVDTAVNLSHGNLLILDIREDLTGAGENQPIRVLVPADASQLVGTEVLACLRRMKQFPAGRFAVGRPSRELFSLRGTIDPVPSMFRGMVTEPQELLRAAYQGAMQRRMMAVQGIPVGSAFNAAGGGMNAKPQAPPPFGAWAAPREPLGVIDARAWAADEVPERRLWGARALARYWVGELRPENERILRELLWDPFYTLALSRRWEPDVGRRVWRVHPIRREAHGALWERNIYVDDSSMTPHPAYERLPWGTIGGVGLLVIGVVGWWGGRGRGRRMGRVGAVMAVLLGSISILVIVGHRRSSRQQDTFNFAWRGFDWEVTSVDGRISILRVESGAPSRGVAWWSVRRGEVDDGGKEWYSKMVSPAKEGRFRGIEWASGDVVGVLKFHKYAMVRGPHWLVWAAMGAWPAWWAATRGVRGWRRWRWGRSGRCLACGYDLRGSTGRRCSECGEYSGLVNVAARGTSGAAGGRRMREELVSSR